MIYKIEIKKTIWKLALRSKCYQTALLIAMKCYRFSHYEQIPFDMRICLNAVFIQNALHNIPNLVDVFRLFSVITLQNKLEKE